MFSEKGHLIPCRGSDAQSRNDGEATEEVRAARVDDAEHRQTGVTGFVLGTKQSFGGFDAKTDLGPRGMREVLVVSRQYRRVRRLREEGGTDVSVTSLAGNLAGVHAEITTHEGVESQRRVLCFFHGARCIRHYGLPVKN